MLIPHPQSRATSAERIVVEAVREAGNRLRLRYMLSGDLTRLKLSPVAVAERRDGLWQTTCFEVFIAGPDTGETGGERYYEFNLSPSTSWAAYRFDGYRDHMTDLEVGAPGLTTVVEDLDGAKGWWALTHGSDEPNFHAMTSFVAELPAGDPA